MEESKLGPAPIQYKHTLHVSKYIFRYNKKQRKRESIEGEYRV